MARPKKTEKTTKPPEIIPEKMDETPKEIAEVLPETPKFATFPDIIRKTAVIIGYPKSGKTTYTEYLKTKYPNHTYISCDDYKDRDYETALYDLIGDIKKQEGKYLVIEGVLGYRLLRKGIKTSIFAPQMIIRINRPEEQRNALYGDKISRIQSFCKQLETVWREYRTLCDTVEVVEVENNA